MSLIHIHSQYVDAVWPQVAHLLKPALDCNKGEATLDQVRMQVAQGQAHLLVAQESDEVVGAGIIEFVQHPNRRVAHVSYIGGRHLVNANVHEELKQWCRSHGASEVRALCDEAHTQLFSRVGYEEIYTMVRITL